MVEARNVEEVGGFDQFEQLLHRYVEEALVVIGEREPLAFVGERVLLDKWFQIL